MLFNNVNETQYSSCILLWGGHFAILYSEKSEVLFGEPLLLMS
jgi:hypothetical protein